MRYQIASLNTDEFLALRAAVVGGAFAERNTTLRALMEHNNGTQVGDSYERELKALARAADAVVAAKPLGGG
jgi:hypothetical protein